MNLSTGGYNRRAATLITGINELLNQVSPLGDRQEEAERRSSHNPFLPLHAHTQIDEMKLEVSCFKRLRTIEDQSVGKRFSKLQAEVSR